MKAKLLILAVSCVAAVAIFVPRTAEAQPPSVKPVGPVESPVGLECVVTVEIEAWMNTTPNASQPGGFHPDYTVRGKVLELGREWVVLKDGNFENWISRDKIVSMRVSR
jgi:hypothetical protein